MLGVLGPDFAETALGLEPKDFAVIVLPLGGGIVMGIMLLNSYGKFLPRRRVIEGGLITLGIMLALLSVAGPISRFLQSADSASSLLDLSAVTSLLAVVVVIAFVAGIAYGAVAIPSQTQLQEDLPEEVRGRVFGVLNMLVSVSSFLPIIIVGPISDLIGTATVMLVVGIGVLASGIASVFLRDPNLGIAGASADPHFEDPLAAALGADRPTWREDPDAPQSKLPPPVDPVAMSAPDPAEHQDDTVEIDARSVGRRDPSDTADPADGRSGRPGRPRLTPSRPWPASRSCSRAGRSAWASTRWRAATCPRSTGRRSWPGRRGSRRSPTSSRSTAGSRPRVTSRSRTCSTSAASSRRRWTIPRSMASSSSRARTRSRRRASPGTSCFARRSRSS